MADRTVKVTVDANITGLQAKMKAAKGAVQDFASNASKYIKENEQSISTMSNSMMLFGGAATAAAGIAVKKFADFDEAMSSVQAATMESTDNMALLRDAAIEAGADTQYSATEAAGAIEALAKAGVSTADILEGGLAGALDLAASGQIDVAQAAEIAATSMNQFGLKGADMTHIADLLAAAAGKAMGDVTDMAQAFKYVGPVASQMGISIEETAGAIAYLAQQGVLGDQAGTSLRGMLSSLTSPSKIAATTMEELGISVYDASGKFVGFRGVAEQLKQSMSGLTNAERDQALGRIFGNEQITTARILYQGGADAIDEWTAAVDDSGFAAEQAALKTDNLKGDIERLGGSLETLFIKSGEGANGALRFLVQGAESLVDAFGQLPEPILNATTLLVGAGGLTALGIGGFGKLMVSINNVKEAASSLGPFFKKASISAGLVGTALGIGAIAFASWAENAAEARARTEEYLGTLDELGNVTSSTMSKINSELSADNRNWGEKLFGDGQAKSIIDDAAEIGLSVEQLTGYILGNKDAIEEVNAAIAATKKETGSAGIDFDGFKKSLDDQSNSLTNAEKQAEQKAQADREAGVASTEAATATETYSSKLAEGTATAEDYSNALTEIIEAMQALGEINMSADEALLKYIQTNDAFIEGLNDSLEGVTSETEALLIKKGALADVTRAGNDVISTMDEQGASAEDLGRKTVELADDFMWQANQVGIVGDEAVALAADYGRIPNDVRTVADFEKWKAEQEANGYQQILDAMDGRSINTYVTTHYLVTGDPTGTKLRSQGITAGQQTYATGGYTGDGERFAPAGIVHRSEYVFSKPAVDRLGVPFLEALHRGTLSGHADGGLAGGAGRQVVPAALQFPTPSSVIVQPAPTQVIRVPYPAHVTVVDSDQRLTGSMRVIAVEEATGVVSDWEDVR